MPAPVLITLAPSHYCEKARWALDRAGVGYVERRHVPLVSRAFTVPRGGRTVPMLVTPHGVLKDSDAIVDFADRRLPAAARLLPDEPAARADVRELVARFDRRLGVAVRAFAYSYLLDERTLLLDVLSAGVPALERAALRVALPGVVRVMRAGLRIGPGTRAWARARVDEELAFAAARLADGRAYLAGDRLSAADVSFAALLAPSVAPVGYGSALPPRASLPAELADELERVRASPAGAFVERIYRDHRAERVS